MTFEMHRCFKESLVFLYNLIFQKIKLTVQNCITKQEYFFHHTAMKNDINQNYNSCPKLVISKYYNS